MAEAALISGLLSNLSPLPLIKDEFSLLWSFKKEVQKLSSTLSSISAVLEDAERKKDKDKQTEDWLRKLKDVAYEVRDIMDDCTYEDLRLQVNRRNASSSTRIKVTNSITHPFISTWTRLKVGHKIKDVQEKLNQISSERQTLHLRESIHDKFTSRWRETISLSSCNKVYGRDMEKKKIIDILVNNTSGACVDKKLSVLPIVGIGGLGKTTLAQTVFNDEEIAKHFEIKIWVCVSDEFDIQLVMKAILEEEKAEARSEELQKKVREKLSGKRYLIVLDDVWNEKFDEWDRLRSILDCGSNGAFVLTTTRKRNVATIMETIHHIQISLLSDEDCWLLFEERAFMCGTPKTPNFVDIGKEIAKKCKGVPLVAKTFGGQLSFKSDINEWSKIRDNEVWKTSQNEKESDLLPILRLSYYELPYHFRRCFVFCAIFPKDAKIEKERLIQLWMAHDLIPTVKNQEVEDIGNTIWKELCWRSFFQDEKLDCFGKEICKMHDLMHDLAQSVMKDECYRLDANSSNDGLKREIRHVRAIFDEFVKISTHSLKKIGGLQTLIFIKERNDKNVIKRISLSVLKKELPTLRVLKLGCYYVQYQDLHYLGCLKHLRYLDISGNKEITTLPDSICDLLNLQTLKLNGCSKLENLPRNTKDLISLRHLYLEGCDGLKCMPREMGQLKHLKTLSLFVIGMKEKDGQLDELKELDICGSLTIKNLGRVSDATIARRVSMAKMSSINELELFWRSDDEVDDNESKSTRDEKIGEALEVSTMLKTLMMYRYKGVNLPKLVSPTIPSAGVFPNLSELMISDCPKLGRLPPHLKALKDVTVWGECSDELLYSISNLSALTHLTLVFMIERSVLFGAGYKALMFDDEIPSTSSSSNNNSEAQLRGGVRSTFQSLQSLHISYCFNLRRLFDEGMISKISGCQNKHFINSLTELWIIDCPELMISVEEFVGNLNINNNSLQRLYISRCPKLVSSEEADDVIALLRSLRTRLCPKMFHLDILLGEEQKKKKKSQIRRTRRKDPLYDFK
ncbi:disease resistance protein RGA2-like isoform X1 [Impatiens glandulifera]|uniref:disease resistance protein RGA2-like isoform X1 n=1 Tax=Impatiens glandulifera TaxID=253017 RepID=UPI001FB070B0|nr:disease resistance protein RGA2-like isoform X1 [Impatiens glandulifera]XP_047337527.1 disease resistance protein RGA2-like isoform X1 [Impatiens glandulifera]